MSIRRRLLAAAGGALALAAIGWAAWETLDRAFPPPLPERLAVSTRCSTATAPCSAPSPCPTGAGGLQPASTDVDPQFIGMLIAYEDKRFRHHRGVDGLALLRAAGQLAANGRIVSGGSTLSMQLARLIEPRRSRSLGTKFRQIFRALQIEGRLSKDRFWRIT